jgi:nucleosome binding factor SPN SPT16 subunit
MLVIADDDEEDDEEEEEEEEEADDEDEGCAAPRALRNRDDEDESHANAADGSKLTQDQINAQFINYHTSLFTYVHTRQHICSCMSITVNK